MKHSSEILFDVNKIKNENFLSSIDYMYKINVDNNLS